MLITSLADIIKAIHTANNIVLPKTLDDYERMRESFMYIDVRRKHSILDAMRECKKKFDCKK